MALLYVVWMLVWALMARANTEMASLDALTPKTGRATPPVRPLDALLSSQMHIEAHRRPQDHAVRTIDIPVDADLARGSLLRVCWPAVYPVAVEIAISADSGTKVAVTPDAYTLSGRDFACMVRASVVTLESFLPLAQYLATVLAMAVGCAYLLSISL